MRTALAAVAVLAALAFSATAQASESPVWNPTACQGYKWTECPILPGSQCEGLLRKGQILVRLDTCVETWFPNYRRHVRLKIRRHRL